jgi:hypothetical protein
MTGAIRKSLSDTTTTFRERQRCQEPLLGDGKGDITDFQSKDRLK